MPNRFPGYCIDCGAEVPAGHGELKKSGTRWQVSCGGKGKSPAKKRAVATDAKAPATPPLLNSPVIPTSGAAELSEEDASRILQEIGSAFARPLPAAKPTMGIGYKLTIDGVEREIGTCNKWVGLIVDYKAREAWVISLIDGAVLDHRQAQDERDVNWMQAPLSKYTRELGAPISAEAHGKNSVKVGAIQRQGGLWFIVTATAKPYYLSNEDAEDFDMFSRGGGWGTPYEMREITEPQGEREKREAQEQAEAAQAAPIVAGITAARAKIAELLPNGIRPLAREEHDLLWASVHGWKETRDGQPVTPAVELLINPARAGAEKLPARVQGIVAGELGRNWDRLPPMPGNEQGLYGWEKLYQIGDRVLIYSYDASYDGMGPMLMGVSILPKDAELLADFAQRSQIKGYRFDPVLWDLLVELDAAGKIAHGKMSYFGGKPFSPAELGPYTIGAYSGRDNKTGAEKRAKLIEYLSTQSGPEVEQALANLTREDSIVEIRSEEK